MDDKVIVGIGEALWDVLPEGKKIGGAPANFAYHVSQFGLESCAVSAVGDDELGQEIRSNFEEKKLQTLIETVPYPKGECCLGQYSVHTSDRGVGSSYKGDLLWFIGSTE